MSIPLWGQLQKAQDDPETIEEAIARMISEHEEDPEAHLGEGESLSAHKHETVIDHPPASILPDKATDNDMTYKLTFESLDAFSKSAQTTPDNLKAKFVVTNAVNNNAFLEVNVIDTSKFSNTPASMLADVAVYFQSANDATARWEWGRMFMNIENNRVRGCSWLNSTETPTYTDWYTVDVTKVTRLRMYHSVTENKTRFYVDGDLIGTVDDTLAFSSEELFGYLNLARNTATTATFYATSMGLSLFEFQY